VKDELSEATESTPATGSASEEPVITLTLDAEGGDHAPEETVAGALEAASPRLKLLLVGRPGVVEPLIVGPASEHVELVPSASVINSKQEPVAAVKALPDSSIAVGARTVAEGRSQGFVSAGSTGAMLAAALLIVKRAGNIRRPAIVTTLPGLRGPVVFLDAGANADCRPEHLVEFGVLGTAFARTVLGVAAPRVGLLNIGEEDSKGSELARAANESLRRSPLNFIGNVEGRDLLQNAADVVVTDGFTGNVALKLLEGCASTLFAEMKEAASSGWRSRAGGLLLRRALRGLRADLDPEAYGGTYLLGVRGLVVICHGNSSRTAIANALRFGAEALRKGVLPAVDAELERMTRSFGSAAS
jgi:glycerol-3-phosphate acyltransferase PlsX